MKICKLLLSAIVALSLISCSAPKVIPFEVVNAVLYTQAEAKELSLSGGATVVAAEGDRLVLRFSHPLGTDALPAGADLVAADTLRMPVTTSNPVVIIPQGLKNASGVALTREYVFKFKFNLTSNSSTWNYENYVPDTRSYLYMNGRRWFFDPLTIEELVVPGEGLVFINIGGIPYRRDVHPGVEEINIVDRDVSYQLPVRYLPELGFNPVLRLSLSPYSDLGMNRGCTFPVLENEDLTLTLYWPFLREDIEARLQGALGEKLRALEWRSEKECRLVVQGSPGDTVGLGLGSLKDIYGYTHEAEPDMEPYSTHFTLKFHAYPTIVRRNVAGKDIASFPIPLHFDGVTKWVPEKQQVRLYRLYPFESPAGAYEYLQEFVYDVAEQRIQGEIDAGTYDFPPTHWTAYKLVRDKGPEGGQISHLALSPNGKAAGLFRLPTGNKMTVYDPATDTVRSFDLMSGSSNDGGGPPPEKMHWSADERYLIYRPWDEKNSPGVYVLDTMTGSEKKILEGYASVNSVSPFGERLIVSSYVEQSSGWLHHNIIVDFNGNHRLLNSLPDRVGIIEWLSRDRLLTVRYSNEPTVLVESFVFDLSNDTLIPLGPGHAIGHDPETGDIYLVVS